MTDGAEFCWISRGGHLQSGDRERMIACLKDGSLPTDNPVTRAGWAGWFAAREVIENDGAPTTREPTFDLVNVSRRFDLDADSTIQRLRRLPSFEDAPDTCRDNGPPLLSEPSNPTHEIATIPTGLPAFCPEDAPSPRSGQPPQSGRVTLQSPQFPPKLVAMLAQPPPPPRRPAPARPPALPRPVPPRPPTLQPTAVTAATPPPPATSTPPPVAVTPTQVPSVFPTAIDVRPSAPKASLWPALIGLGLAAAGAATAALIVAQAASQLTAPTLHSGVHRVQVPAVEKPVALSSQCRTVGDERQLTKLVPPGSTVHLGGSRVIEVGVPSSLKSGLGIVLDPSDLSERSRDVFSDSVRVSGVVPRGDGTFVVDRYTVSVGGRFSLGMTPEGFSRITSGESQAIWPGDAARVITRPTITPTPSGYIVAFRRGDGAGSVRVGMVDTDGNKKTELARLGEELVSAGSPSVAVGAESTAVLFSGRDDEGTRRLFMGTAPRGGVPTSVRAIDVSSGSPSSPALAALDGGRFLVAWVQRQEGARRLMGRVIDSNLELVAPAVEWMKLDVPVASTALWVGPTGAAVLVTKVATGSRHELSAIRLQCPAESPALASR